jgi:hypothetical protein
VPQHNRSPLSVGLVLGDPAALPLDGTALPFVRDHLFPSCRGWAPALPPGALLLLDTLGLSSGAGRLDALDELLPRRDPVSKLGPLALGADLNAGRLVSQVDRGGGPVDVLPTGASCTTEPLDEILGPHPELGEPQLQLL